MCEHHGYSETLQLQGLNNKASILGWQEMGLDYKPKAAGKDLTKIVAVETLLGGGCGVESILFYSVKAACAISWNPAM